VTLIYKKAASEGDARAPAPRPIDSSSSPSLFFPPPPSFPVVSNSRQSLLLCLQNPFSKKFWSCPPARRPQIRHSASLTFYSVLFFPSLRSWSPTRILLVEYHRVGVGMVGFIRSSVVPLFEFPPDLSSFLARLVLRLPAVTFGSRTFLAKERTSSSG